MDKTRKYRNPPDASINRTANLRAAQNPETE